ncbi:hypothetical protein HEP84_01810 [Streptomyces sp. RLB1-33]|nr:hypothetical protein [Streptomyces sp. RLB1-33]
MHDARALIDMSAEAVRRLARTGYALDLPRMEDLQLWRNQSIRSADELRAAPRRVAQLIERPQAHAA